MKSHCSLKAAPIPSIRPIKVSVAVLSSDPYWSKFSLFRSDWRPSL